MNDVSRARTVTGLAPFFCMQVVLFHNAQTRVLVPPLWRRATLPVCNAWVGAGFLCTIRPTRCL